MWEAQGDDASEEPVQGAVPVCPGQLVVQSLTVAVAGVKSDHCFLPLHAKLGREVSLRPFSIFVCAEVEEERFSCPPGGTLSHCCNWTARVRLCQVRELSAHQPPTGSNNFAMYTIMLHTRLLRLKVIILTSFLSLAGHGARPTSRRQGIHKLCWGPAIVLVCLHPRCCSCPSKVLVSTSCYLLHFQAWELGLLFSSARCDTDLSLSGVGSVIGGLITDWLQSRRWPPLAMRRWTGLTSEEGHSPQPTKIQPALQDFMPCSLGGWRVTCALASCRCML